MFPTSCPHPPAHPPPRPLPPPPPPNRSSLARPQRPHSARPGPKRPQNRPARRPPARAAGLPAPNATALAGPNGLVRLGAPRGLWRDVTSLCYAACYAAESALQDAGEVGRAGCLFWLDPEVQDPARPPRPNRAAGAASRGVAAPTPTPHATPKPPPTRSSARSPAPHQPPPGDAARSRAQGLGRAPRPEAGADGGTKCTGGEGGRARHAGRVLLSVRLAAGTALVARGVGASEKKNFMDVVLVGTLPQVVVTCFRSSRSTTMVSGNPPAPYRRLPRPQPVGGPRRGRGGVASMQAGGADKQPRAPEMSESASLRAAACRQRGSARPDFASAKGLALSRVPWRPGGPRCRTDGLPAPQTV